MLILYEHTNSNCVDPDCTVRKRWHIVERFVYCKTNEQYAQFWQDVQVLNQYGIRVAFLNDRNENVREATVEWLKEEDYSQLHVSRLGIVFEDDFQEMLFRMRYI